LEELKSKDFIDYNNIRAFLNDHSKDVKPENFYLYNGQIIEFEKMINELIEQLNTYKNKLFPDEKRETVREYEKVREEFITIYHIYKPYHDFQKELLKPTK
jgi:hypothetical protein